ncbi:conserved hypothetical protein [Ixodes scapularis]|uniref:Inhibitor of growth protein n=1 Tax=Ixodes scapularis TaxID=6945 RepID=B7PV48_IXOSC|nr:conserved hypothetical protein [Ixodes scapularis]|eukprot:XP_002407397.1 conserved hypothetical protein [Ixodes scapularis]
MRDLDSRVQGISKNIEKLSHTYLNNAKTYTASERSEHLENIRKMFEKAKEYGDDKVQLAMQTYEMVRRRPVEVPLLQSISISHPSDVLDMPVDPNEPTYCLCHQVSYGEMIGCDNPDCPIEWFHFTCVGLTSKPKGKWFCPKCSTDRKKK